MKAIMSSIEEDINSSLSKALTFDDDIITEDNLNYVLIKIREAVINDLDSIELIRDSINKYLLSLSNSYCNYEINADNRLLCLRIIGNSVADNDNNRKVILENKKFMYEIINSISPGNSKKLRISFKNIILSVIFNLCNDSELETEYFVREDNDFGKNLFHLIEENSANDEFLLHVALVNVELLTDKQAKNVPSNASVILLNVDDYSVNQILFRLIETFTEQEDNFKDNKDNFIKLLRKGLDSLEGGNDDDSDDSEVRENFKSIIAVMGNISSHSEFSDLVNISYDDEIFSLIIREFVDSNNSFKVSIGLCLLGNLVISSEKVSILLDLIPNLIPNIMKSYQKMNSPFELQSAHLIKNLILAGDNASLVLENEGINLIKKLLNVKLFPIIRLLGVQITKKLLSKASNNDKDELLKLILDSIIIEDDSKVQLEIDNALIAAIDSDITNSLFSEQIIEQLLKESIRIGNQSNASSSSSSDSQANPLLLRITRSLGVASSKPQLLPLFSKNNDNLSLSKSLLQFGISLNKSSSTSATNDTITKGIINNISFISANLQTFPDLSDISTELLRLTT